MTPAEIQKTREAEARWFGAAPPGSQVCARCRAPGLFVETSSLPRDLEECVAALRRAMQPPDFRDVPGAKVLHWLLRVGRKNKLRSRLKSFRFQAHEQRLLETLSTELNLSETDVVRQALLELAERTHPRPR